MTEGRECWFWVQWADQYLNFYLRGIKSILVMLLRIFLFSLLLSATSLLSAAPFGLDFLERKAERIETKRIEKKMWDRPGNSRFQNKRFPIKEWNKHFSSMGSKRSAISTSEAKEKKLFKTKVLDRKTMEIKMSRWDDRMSDLFKKAGIQMDDRAKGIAQRRVYDEMLRDAQQYRELGETLSLRDINRYQFRRNRSSDGIPVQKAADGQR